VPASAAKLAFAEAAVEGRGSPMKAELFYASKQAKTRLELGTF
jgi:hypothetical protein